MRLCKHRPQKNNSAVKEPRPRLGKAQSKNRQMKNKKEIRRILITAGPTREMLDPVRFISNLSTGELGFTLANCALQQGYAVTLISGPTALTPPRGIRFIPVVSSEDMRKACEKHFFKQDALIMTAAVADFTPSHREKQKIKRRETQSVVLKRTKDILAGLGPRKGERIVIGFCLETEKWLEYAKLKLQKKKLNGIVANFYEPGKVYPFGKNPMTSAFIGQDLKMAVYRKLNKTQMSKKILTWMEKLAVSQGSSR